MWIVTDDQPFTVVECPEFCSLIKICNPDAKIPSADTMKNDILKLFQSNLLDIKQELVVILFINFFFNYTII